MAWEIIGVVAEVIGAVAVVVTLIFLAVEVRRNRHATQAASADAQASGINSLNSVLVSDPGLVDLWLAGLADPTQLDAQSRMRLAMHLQSYVNHYIALRRHYDAGSLAEGNWDFGWQPFCALLNTPGGRIMAKELAIPPELIADIVAYGDANGEYSWMPTPAKADDTGQSRLN